VAAVVIAISAEGRRRARAADVAAAQTEALQRLARAVIEHRPSKEVTQAAARALHRMFRIPAVVLAERGGAFELAGRAGVEKLTDADREAAVAAVAAHAPTRGGEYPVDAARFDFWPFGSGDGAVVIGLDFSDADDGHPRDLARLVELVGGYVAAARMLDSRRSAGA
jgi:K+-sensing histidine kinase KdpD